MHMRALDAAATAYEFSQFVHMNFNARERCEFYKISNRGGSEPSL